ncbi:MAG: c-type cytochrome, partial [Rhodospirillales bacterium]
MNWYSRSLRSATAALLLNMPVRVFLASIVLLTLGACEGFWQPWYEASRKEPVQAEMPPAPPPEINEEKETTEVGTAVNAQVPAAEKHGQAGHQETVPDHPPLNNPVKLMIPVLNAVKGKELFIEKGCITCHAVNGVGGEDGPQIDAHVMEPHMDVFQFAARMWNHSQGMVAAQ